MDTNPSNTQNAKVMVEAGFCQGTLAANFCVVHVPTGSDE